MQKSVEKLGLKYPTAIDNNCAIWRAFDNQYWPAHYLVDAEGKIRYTHSGEGSYDTQEKVIQQLLAEAKNKGVMITGDEPWAPLVVRRSPSPVPYHRFREFSTR